MEKSCRCHHFLSTEDLPATPQTSLGVVLSRHDVLGLEAGDGPGPAPDPKLGPVTVTTVNVSVRAGAVGGDAQLSPTATAGETLPVIRARPAQHLVNREDLVSTPQTPRLVPGIRTYPRLLSELVPGVVSKLSAIACLREEVQK